jgi:hypothetical protein
MASDTRFYGEVRWRPAATPTRYSPVRPDSSAGWDNYVCDARVQFDATPDGGRLQLLVLGLAILLDQRPDPVFARWGAFNIIAGLLFLPNAFAVVYKTGPFAWDGVLAFWLKLALFAVYLAVMFFLVHAAIQRQQQEGQPT